MATIAVSSVSAAMFLSVSISGVLISIQSLGHVIPDSLFGTAIIILSLFTVITGITSVSNVRAIVISLMILLATVWMSVGMTKLWTDINESYNITTSANNKEYLLPGYGSCLLVVIVFVIVSIGNKNHRYIAVLCGIISVLFIFEIVSVWMSQEVFTGGANVILVVFLCYFVLSNSLKVFCGNNAIAPYDASDRTENQPSSHDYHVLWYATSAISYSVFALQITGLSTDTKFAFSWPLCAGIVQLIVGTSVLRRHDAINGAHIMIYGLTWSSFGCNLWLDMIREDFVPLRIPVCVILVTIFIVLGVINIKLELLRSVSCLCMALFIISLSADGHSGYFIGTTGFLGLFISLYGVLGHLCLVAKFTLKVPIKSLIRKRNEISDYKLNCCNSKIKPAKTKGALSAEVMLGYSKYVDVQCLGFLVNSVAALSLIPTYDNCSVSDLPFCIGFGGIIQIIIGFVAFSRGLTFESSSYLVYALFWSIWGTISILDINNGENDVSGISGCISFLVIGVTFICLSATVSVLWFCVSCCFSLVVLSMIVRNVTGGQTDIFQMVALTLFTMICIYAFMATFLRNLSGHEIIPTGKPIISISLLAAAKDKNILADSRKATGVRQIANMMNCGKICGIPTDTVYILTAACNQSAAVERAYKTKKLAEDRPMSVWLSNLNQIRGAKEEFGLVLWDFLTEIWPSNISAVVRKGKWVGSLGLGDSEKYIGKPDSIAIRIPDNSITCHLIDHTGPIAVTSANPTGEADTTHHLQVIAKLGNKNCDGVLCDGPSPENAASTVVDCRNVNKGKIGFFRIGLTPKSQVEEIFEKVLVKHNLTSDSSSVDSGVSSHANGKAKENGYDNDEFDMEEIPLEKTKTTH